MKHSKSRLGTLFGRNRPDIPRPIGHHHQQEKVGHAQIKYCKRIDLFK